MMPNTDPPRTGLSIHSMQVECLKNLQNLDLISFEDKPITGIFGPNCSGKSTILHALACLYQPPADSQQFDYKFSYFFLPNTDALWDGSKITVTHTFRFQTSTFERKKWVYQKKRHMWAPRADRRPSRHVVYIGVGSCVPQIEMEIQENKINYTTTTRTGDLARQTREALEKIFNRTYDELNEHLTGKVTYKGLKSAGIRYSSLSMGAGEQRMLNILEAVFSSPKHSLILIDELDLLLHEEALHNFLEVLSKRAQDKNIQVVFTSHRECLLDHDELINIRHIHNTPAKTRCLNETKPEALRRLTGKQEKPLEIFVEDDLATAIVNKVAASLGMKKVVKTIRFGAAKNSFTILAGMILQEQSVENSLFVLDGDEYRGEDLKRGQINLVLTGNAPKDDERRDNALSVMLDFGLPEGAKPEKYFHKMIIELDPSTLSLEEIEVQNLAKGIHAPMDKHDYLAKLYEILGYDNRGGLQKFMDMAIKSPLWDDYVLPVANWLEVKKPDVEEELAPSEPLAEVAEVEE